MNNRKLTQASIIAAMYATLTLIFAPISYGQIQFRVSEILTVLPFFTSAAVPGLFVGCIISNLASPVGIVDVIFGSAATLIAAYMTYRLGKADSNSSKKLYKILAPTPAIIVNGIIVGIQLKVMLKLPLVPSMLYVAAGEAVICFAGGYALMFAIEKANFKEKLFK